MGKRILKILASVLTIAILCTVFAACERGGDTSRFQIEESDFVESSDVVAMTRKICEDYAVRTSGSVNSTTGLANDYTFLNIYVGGKMREFGYAALSEDGQDARLETFRFTDIYDQSKLKTGYNAVWEKRVADGTQSKGEIWIVAAYDNSAGITVSDMDMTTGNVTSALLGGEGAYGSATSVATALAIADRLAEKQLEYDVVFAFVGCSQFSNEGIREMLANHDAPDLVINLNRLGGGTYNYIYSAETKTDFNDAFYAAAYKVGGDTFAPVPGNTHAIDATIAEGQPNDYTHIGMYGDNLFTMIAGIPTVSFLSLDWSSDTNPFYTEIDGKENVYNTSADTFENMIARLGEDGEAVLAKRLDAVADTVATMLSAENGEVLDSVLATAAEQASVDAQKSHGDAGTYTRLAIIVAAVIAAVVLMIVGRNKTAEGMRKKIDEVSRRNSAPVTPREDVFEGFSDANGTPSDGGDKSDKPDDPFEY